MKSVILLIFFLLFFVSQTYVFADDVSPNVGGAGRNTFRIFTDIGFKQAPGSSAEGVVGTITKNVIILLFTVGGIGTIIYFLWGAVEWIFSGGDKEKVGNARRRMTHALIGLTLLALSFVIINLVGNIVGFNPLGNLQIRGLGDDRSPVVPNQTQGVQ